jgi:hypothetical protein
MEIPIDSGQGPVKAVRTELYQSLLKRVNHIGLSIKSNNISAIVCYEKLDFERFAHCGKCILELKSK